MAETLTKHSPPKKYIPTGVVKKVKSTQLNFISPSKSNYEMSINVLTVKCCSFPVFFLTGKQPDCPRIIGYVSIQYLV